MMIKNKILVVILIIMCVVLIISIVYRKDIRKFAEKTIFSMDTIVTIQTPNENDINSIQTQIDTLNNILDRHSPNTDMYYLNTEKYIKSSVISNLISQTLELNNTYGYKVDITSGNLVDIWNISENPTIPTDIQISTALKTIGIENISIKSDEVTLSNDTILDIGSVAKGYALDIIQSNLQTLDNTYISMGSSTLLCNVQDFKISIRSPEDTTSGILGNFSIDGTGFISTSGGYERYIEIDGVKYPHILDLSTGYPSNTDLTSVTVYTDSGIKSDFLSTYIFLEGTENLEKYLNDDTIKIIAVDDNRNVYISKGLDFRITDNSFKLVQNP